MLRRVQAHSLGSCFLLADGNRLPLRDQCVDLACFAQSWHWFDLDRASGEAARVLRPGGFWAAWWNHAWADGEEWFEIYQDLLEWACPGYDRQHRDPSWAEERIGRTGLFEPATEFIVRWTRVLSTERWLTFERSKSDLSALGPADRERLRARIANLIGDRFPDGRMSVPHRTRMWLARRLRPAAG
jgi:SAM-dependent methyltransferase